MRCSSLPLAFIWKTKTVTIPQHVQHIWVARHRAIDPRHCESPCRRWLWRRPRIVDDHLLWSRVSDSAFTKPRLQQEDFSGNPVDLPQQAFKLAYPNIKMRNDVVEMGMNTNQPSSTKGTVQRVLAGYREHRLTEWRPRVISWNQCECSVVGFVKVQPVRGSVRRKSLLNDSHDDVWMTQMSVPVSTPNYPTTFNPTRRSSSSTGRAMRS